MTFRPLLAADATDADIRYPVLASPKIDGIRCLIVNGQAVTRSLKPIPNLFIRRMLEKYAPDGADGEIVVGDSFNATTSAVMSRDGEPVFTYFVFDDCREAAAPISFRLRCHDMTNLLAESIDLRGSLTAGCSIQFLPHNFIETAEEMQAYYQKCLTQGYEGVMIRDPLGVYKHGRSTKREGILLKLKPFADAEAVVVRIDELQHNGNAAETNALGLTERSTAASGKSAGGTMGRLLVKAVTGDYSGKEFFIGTGFDQTLRNEIWASPQKFLGKKLTFKYQAHGSVDLPRIPVFLRWRDDA
ncbi:MAG: ATP-dependent DNA ligase [Planctomyces sp.]|jgi:DNA ligase-1